MMDPAIISLKDFFKGIYFKNLHTQLNQTSEQNLGGGGVSMLILALLCIKHDYSAMKVKLLFHLKIFL